MILLFLMGLAVFLAICVILVPCGHEHVYPGRDSDTGVFYLMCAQKGCHYVQISGSKKWIPPDKVEAAFQRATREQE